MSVVLASETGECLAGLMFQHWRGRVLLCGVVLVSPQHSPGQSKPGTQSCDEFGRTTHAPGTNAMGMPGEAPWAVLGWAAAEGLRSLKSPVFLSSHLSFHVLS